MGIKIGIPRALLYYDYFLFWSTFFEGLGAEIILSPKTNKEILNSGIKAVEETCLPVKVFMGHVQSLANQKIDYLFIPRYVSTEPRRFPCPKFMGLPDMVKELPGIPPALNVDIDIRKHKGEVPEEMYRLGRVFTFNPWKIRLAYRLALENQESFKNRMHRGLQPEEIFFNRTDTKTDRTLKQNSTLRLGLIGHSYNLYDRYINMDIITKLQEMGAEIVTSKMFSDREINQVLKKLQKDIFWSFGKETIGSAYYLLDDASVDGIILLVSFACGPDSLIVDLIERAYKRTERPFLTLVLDEHSAEGGIITRLEAFIEMLKRRKQKNESYISTYGKSVDCPEDPILKTGPRVDTSTADNQENG